MKFKISTVVDEENVGMVARLLAQQHLPVVIRRVKESVEIPLSFSEVNPEPPPARRRETIGRQKRGGECPTRDSHLGRLVMAMFKTTPLVRALDAAEHGQKHGYSPTSATAILSNLLSEGDLVRVKRGLYRLPLTSERGHVNGQSA